MSNNYQTIINLVKQISGQKSTIGIPRIYIQITKSLAAGAFLSQIIYWADRATRPDGFFWKSAKEWNEELELSYDQVKRLTKKLEKDGLIETKLMRANNAPTTHYRPDMEKITDLIVKFLDFRETRKSGNSNFEKLKSGFSRNSKNHDFRETLKSITEREITAENEPSDYLSDILSGTGQNTEDSEPSDFDKYFGKYRDAACNIYQQTFGRHPNPGHKEALIEMSRRPDFEPESFSTFLAMYNQRGGYPYDLDRIETEYGFYLANGTLPKNQTGVSKINQSSQANNTVTVDKKDGGMYL